MFGVTAIAIIYASIHKTAGEKLKPFNFKNPPASHPIMDNYNNKPILTGFGFIGALITVVFVVSKLWVSNPIIGEWQSETVVPFIGKSINTIEFTEDRVYSMGMVSKVNYEIESDKVIVTDGLGIGIVYEMIDKDTMKNNMLGVGETIYRRMTPTH